MPDSNQNYVLGIKTPADTSGLKQVAGGLADIRKQAETPIKGPRVIPDIGNATEVVNKLRQDLLAMGTGKIGAEVAIDRLRASLKAAGGDIDAIKAKLRTDVGAINGPAVKPRFDPKEQAIRDTQAGTIQGLRRKTEAANQADDRAAMQAEANRRLFGNAPPPPPPPSANDNLRGAADDLQVSSRPKPATTIDQAKQRRADAQAKKAGFDALTRDADESRQRVQRAINEISAREKATKARRDSIGNGPGGGGGSGVGTGGGGGRRNNDVIGGGFKLEDKVGLGGGYKLVGAAGVAAAGVAVLGELANAAANSLKDYKDKIAAGANKQDALTVAVADAAKSLPIIGSLVSAVDTLGAELTGEADKLRRRAADDAAEAKNRAGDAKINAFRALAREDVAGLKSQQDDRRVREAKIAASPGDEENAGAAVQAKIELENKLKPLDERIIAIRNTGGVNGGEREKDRDAVNAQIKEANDAYAAKLQDIDKDRASKSAEAANVEVAQRKQNEEVIFGVRQQYLATEGQAIQASIEAIDHATQKSIEEAAARLNDVGTKYGNDSDQYKDAQQTFNQQRDAAVQDQQAARGEVGRQAGLDARAAIVAGLNAKSKIGDDIESAEVAARIVIEDETKQRRLRLHDLIEHGKLDADTLAKAKQQAAELDDVKDRQIAQAKLQIEQEAHDKRAGVVSAFEGLQAESLRKEGARTGNVLLSQDADRLDVQEEYKRKADRLAAIANDTTLNKDQRDQATKDIALLPDELKKALEDVGRNVVSQRDLVGAAAAKTTDFSTYEGVSAAQREGLATSSEAQSLKAQQDIAKTITDFFTAFKTYISSLPGAKPIFP